MLKIHIKILIKQKSAEIFHSTGYIYGKLPILFTCVIIAMDKTLTMIITYQTGTINFEG